MGGPTTGDPRTAAERVPSVTDDFTTAAPGLWDGVKHAASGFNKLMDENPTATKWISFGLAFLAGMTASFIKTETIFIAGLYCS